MASIYDLKPRFQALLRPICRRLAGWGVTANHVTAAALLLSAAHGAWIFLNPSAWSLALLPVTLFLRMALNAIDGMLAREHGMKSDFGALFNELADVAGDAVLYLPFAVLIAPALCVGVVMVGIIAEMAGAIAPAIGAARRYDGPFGKSDRAAFFGLAGFLLGGGVLPLTWFGWALWIALALGLLTIANRVRGALKETAP